MKFWFLDGVNMVNTGYDSVSLELYRAFEGFTQPAGSKWRKKGVDGLGSG
jgi:hypothetical protein